MYSFAQCDHPGCQAAALSGSALCAAHEVDPAAAASRLLAEMSGDREIKSLNLAGLRLEGADLSGKRFYACSFAGAILTNVTFAGSSFRMSFFDFCQADSCDFSGVDAQFCSFAGARFLNASFENSELIHNNFDGIKAEACTFNYSNLYNSRFILSEFDHTDFVDCNLKNCYFVKTRERKVSWKYSNTQEAIRELEEQGP